VLAVVYRHLGHLALSPALFLVPAAVCGLGAMGLVIALVRGTPSLIIDRDGLTRTSLFGSQQILWVDLTDLEWSGSGKSLIVTGAPWDEKQVRLTLSDVYDVSLSTLVQRIERSRRDAVGEHVSLTGRAASSTAGWPQPAADFPAGTIAIALVLTVIYMSELKFSAVYETDWMSTLTAMGALKRDYMMETNEWWRVLTGPLLHGSLSHLVGNLVVLVFAGRPLERVVGTVWFFAIYLLCTMGGALGTLGYMPGHVPAIGASGAINGVVACGFFLAVHMPPGRVRLWMRLRGLLLVIPNSLPTIPGPGGVQVDYAAHAGGAIVGAIVGLFLSRKYAESTLDEGGQELAVAIAACLGVLTLGSVGALAWRAPLYHGMSASIPEQRLPTDRIRLPAAQELLRDYPNDPNSHLAAAVAHIHDNDPLDADAELREALRLLEALPDSTDKRRAVNGVRATLAQVLLHMNESGEAMAEVRAVCNAPNSEQPDAQAMELLHRAGLCP
jgi:rhomboid protease GluP